jgi:hypothetical protein
LAESASVPSKQFTSEEVIKENCQMKASSQVSSNPNLQNRAVKPPMPLKKPAGVISFDQVKTSCLDCIESQPRHSNVETGNKRLKAFFYKRQGQYEMTNNSLTTLTTVLSKSSAKEQGNF